MTTWRAPGPGRHPAVVLLYGAAGPRIFLDPKHDHHVVPERFAAHGLSVFMPRYSEAPDPMRAARDAIATVARDPDVDAEQIGLMGFSRGAHMALLVAQAEPRVRALVDYYGWLNGDEAAKLERMPPTLILHGERDRDVEVERAHELERLFTAKRVPFEMHLYPKEGHGFDDPALSDSIARALAFFDSRLKPT
jgi:dienelactone hydrolase